MKHVKRTTSSLNVDKCICTPTNQSSTDFEGIIQMNDERIYPMDNTMRLLQRLGITPRYRGYRQLLIALQLLQDDEDKLYRTTLFYAEIGMLSGASKSAVERNLRTIVGRAWEINPRLLEEVAGYPLTYKPTNTDFLSIVLNFMIREDGIKCQVRRI